MKRLVVYCCVGDCLTVLWSIEWDEEAQGFTLYEGIGDTCEKCKNAQIKVNPRPTFKAPKFDTEVSSSSDFQRMMDKRKLDGRKASGKGPSRAGR